MPRSGIVTALTPTELVVLQLLALEYSLAQIASLLELQLDDVHAAASAAAARIGASDWRDAVVLAQRRSLIGRSLNGRGRIDPRAALEN
jgi:DNA-binding NarL/FixJ family response regulator